MKVDREFAIARHSSRMLVDQDGFAAAVVYRSPSTTDDDFERRIRLLARAPAILALLDRAARLLDNPNITCLNAELSEIRELIAIPEEARKVFREIAGLKVVEGERMA